MDAKALEGGRFSMKHYPVNVWNEFMEGRLSPQEQIEAEEHLYGCDECLELYMAALEQAADVPLLPQEPRMFDEQVMLQLNGSPSLQPKRASEQDSSPSPAKRRLLQHPLFHYTVAASITLLLMSSGAFRYVTDQTDEWRNTLSMGNHSSISEQWTDQATEAISNIQLKLKEGPNHAK
jgi:hypothetical protein